MAPKLLPKRKRRTKAATLYNNESVVDARKQLQMATEQSEVQKLKSQLSEAYKTAESNYYKERFDEVSDNFNRNNPSAAWKTIDHMTARKTKTQGRLNGNTPEE